MLRALNQIHKHPKKAYMFHIFIKQISSKKDAKVPPGRVWESLGKTKVAVGRALEGHWSTKVAPRRSTTNWKPFFQQKWARPCEWTSYWNLVCQPKWAKLKQINRKLKTGDILGSKIDHGRTLGGILGSKIDEKIKPKMIFFLWSDL